MHFTELVLLLLLLLFKFFLSLPYCRLIKHTICVRVNLIIWLCGQGYLTIKQCLVALHMILKIQIHV